MEALLKQFLDEMTVQVDGRNLKMTEFTEEFKKWTLANNITWNSDWIATKILKEPLTRWGHTFTTPGKPLFIKHRLMKSAAAALMKERLNLSTQLKHMESLLKQFLDEMMETVEGRSIRMKDLSNSFNKWAKDNKKPWEDGYSKRNLKDHMVGLGYDIIKGTKHLWINNILFKSQVPIPLRSVVPKIHHISKSIDSPSKDVKLEKQIVHEKQPPMTVDLTEDSDHEFPTVKLENDLDIPVLEMPPLEIIHPRLEWNDFSSDEVETSPECPTEHPQQQESNISIDTTSNTHSAQKPHWTQIHNVAEIVSILQSGDSLKLVPFSTLRLTVDFDPVEVLKEIVGYEKTYHKKIQISYNTHEEKVYIELTASSRPIIDDIRYIINCSNAINIPWSALWEKLVSIRGDLNDEQAKERVIKEIKTYEADIKSTLPIHYDDLAHSQPTGVKRKIDDSVLIEEAMKSRCATKKYRGIKYGGYMVLRNLIDLVSKHQFDPTEVVTKSNIEHMMWLCSLNNWELPQREPSKTKKAHIAKYVCKKLEKKLGNK